MSQIGRTYANPITNRDVSLAIERFLVAPLGTPWTPARVDIASPPAGFKDLGPVDEESPTVTISRAQFQLRTGIPQALQFQAVTTVDARVTFNIQSRDTRAIIAALASVPNNAAKYIANDATSIASGATRLTITLTGSPAVPIYVEDMVVTAANTPGLETTQNWAIVTSINGLELHMRGQGFDNTPGSGDWVMKPQADYIPFGTAALPQFHLLGVADFIDGMQLVHRFEKVQGSAEFIENLRASENNKMPFAFNIFGTESAFWGGELIVGERYLFQRP